MSKGARRLTKWVGYPLFAIFAFLVALYVTFPYGKLKTRIEGHLSAGAAMDVSIRELGPSLLLGVKAKDVVIRLAGKEAVGGAAGEGAKQVKPLRLVLDEVSVNTGLLALVSGDVDIDFSVKGMEGSVDGSYSKQKKKWSIKLEASKIKLSKVPFIDDALGLPVSGAVSAKVDLTMVGRGMASAKGKVDISCKGCAVGDGKKKLKIPGNPLLASGITVPMVRLGQLSGQITVDKGVATLQKMSAKSPDIEVAMEGQFTLRQPVAFSVAQAYLKFKISPELKKKDPKFDLVESSLSSAKRSDGFFGLRINGILKSLKVLPSRLGPGKVPGPRPGATTPGGRFRSFPAHGKLITPKKKETNSS